MLLILFWTSPVWALGCPSSIKTSISIHFTKAYPVINNQATQRRMVKSGKRKEHYSQTIGLTKSGLYFKAYSTFSIKSSNLSKQVCVALRDVKVEYGFGNTPVLIDRRYRPGSCEYAVIANHEGEHIAIMNSKGEGYKRWLTQKLNRQLRTITPVLTTRSRRTQRWMSAQVKKIAASLIKQMNESLAAAHGKIDTDENYRLSQARCSGW